MVPITSMIKKISKQKYDLLNKYRDMYDENLSITHFVKIVFNANLKHTSKNITNYTGHITSRFNVTITFNENSNTKLFNHLMKENGKHYTAFILQYRDIHR